MERMSFWQEFSPSVGAITSPSAGPQPPAHATKVVQLTNGATQRARLLCAYSDTVDQLRQVEEAEETARTSRKQTADEGRQERRSFQSADDFDDETGCMGYIRACVQKVDEQLVPYKLLYIFTRGGEACLDLYLSVYALQVGFSPVQLSFIFALPRFIASLSTPICGAIADKFRCRKEMLLLSLCLWVFFFLSINFIPGPVLATCDVARTQFKDTLAKVNHSTASSSSRSSLHAPPISVGLVRDFDETDSQCMIPINASDALERKMWLDILHIVNTPWTNKTEQCYPGGRFWGSAHVAGMKNVEGPSTTYQGWMYEHGSLAASFFQIFLLIAAAYVMQAQTLSLADTATLHTLGPQRSHEYGWQRAFGNAGFAVYIISVTLFIKMSSTPWLHCDVEIVVEDYRIAFVIFLGTTSCAIALLFAYCIKFTRDYPNESNFVDLKKVFCKLGPALYLPILCYLAINEGAIKAFLPFHLSTLGSSPMLIKGAKITQGISELFLAFSLGQLILDHGHTILLVCGTIGYMLSFLAYALITNPPWILLVQVVHGMSVALSWNVLVSRLSVEVLPENLASLQGCLNGLYLLGMGLGAVSAGFAVSQYGTPITFFCLAFVNLAVCTVLAFGSKKHKRRHAKSIKYKPIPLNDAEDQ